MLTPLAATLELVRPDERFVPAPASDGSAGYDVRANLRGRAILVYTPDDDLPGPTGPELRLEHQMADSDLAALTLEPGERALVPLGIKLTVPHGWKVDVCARSGLALTQGVTLANGVGIGDADFFHEYGAIVINHGHAPFVLRDAERIAQLVFVPYGAPAFTRGIVAQTTRRSGGFGHSGRE